MTNLSDKKIILRAPAKINLHLEVLGKRRDGFHELAMVMQSIDLSDYLEIENNNLNQITLNSNSKELELNENNLIIKAGNLLKEFAGNNKLGADIFLKKNIPIGAGLAGGSSDAAATLVGLNKLWNLNLNSKIIHNLASKLGSDIPFCINGGLQYCFGRGEILKKYNLEPKLTLILLKNPNVSISTSDIYKKYSDKFCDSFLKKEIDFEYRRKDLELKDFSKNNILTNGINIRNDLQKIVQNENKSVYQALEILSNMKKALCSSMSGSGPSCFALFDNCKNAELTYQTNKEFFYYSSY